MEFFTKALLLFSCVIFVVLVDYVHLTVVKDYCQSDYFNVTCGADQVIVMQKAIYGRMRTGTCLTGQGGSLGCSTDVLAFMDQQCSGKQKCSVYVGGKELHDTQPCPRDFTSYLEASHDCVTVVTGSDIDCATSSQIMVSEPEGYIASTITTTSSWRQITCPWVIMAQRGQNIKVSLLSFSGGSELGAQCYEIATIREGEHTRPVTTCDASDRLNDVYTSRGETIDITTIEPERLQSPFPFLLRYEAIGCPELKIPKEMWMKRRRPNTDLVTVKCNFTEQSWTLTCKDTEWIGDIGNCSKDKYLSQQGEYSDEEAFPYGNIGILILVAIGVALGVFLGGLLLSLAIVYMKRHQRTHNHQHASSPHHFVEVPIDPNAKYIDEEEATTLNRSSTTNKRAHYIVARQHPGDNTVVTVPEDVPVDGKTVVPCSAYQCRNTINIPGFRLTHLYESPTGSATGQNVAS